MVSNSARTTLPAGLVPLVTAYVTIAGATLVALGILSVLRPAAATSEAWGHAIVVGVLALVLPLRLRAARSGSSRALVAVGVIALVLVAVNVVEALVPGFFPGWMRVEMVVVAVLMAIVALLSLRAVRRRR